MPTLTPGPKLSPRAKAQVLAAFVHRWTHENSRQSYGGRCPACAQGAPPNMPKGQWHDYHAPIVHDEVWLSKYAFWTNRDGTLTKNRRHCEPHYLAKE